jgi:hypothetical protein
MDGISISPNGTSGLDWISQQSARGGNSYLRALSTPPKAAPNVGSGVFMITKSAQGTNGTDKLTLIAAQEMATPEVLADPVVVKARDDRLYLLAMKFSGADQPAEHVARLHILTNRLRVLAPPVSEAAWQRFEEIATDIADRSAEIATLEEELGLS